MVNDAKSLTIVVASDGTFRHLLEEDNPLVAAIHAVSKTAGIHRNSRVDSTGDLSEGAQKWLIAHNDGNLPAIHRWWADMAPVGGPVLGPFSTHNDAITAEIQYLKEHDIPGLTKDRSPNAARNTNS